MDALDPHLPLMSSCRDCARPTPASARSCPHCGILNPVVQWVAYPDGSHVTARVAPDPVAAAAALAGKPAPRPAFTPAPIVRPAAAAPSASADPFAIFTPGAAPLPVMAAAPMADSGEEIDAINKCSTAFYWLAGLNGALGLIFRDVLGNGLLFEAAIMAGLSYALRRYRSRAAAVALVLYAAFTVYVKTMMMLDGGGRVAWIWLWVLVTGMAGKAVLATFKLHGERPAGALA